MKAYLKYIKYAILAVVFIAALAVTGIMNINNISENEGRKASYTRTTFDITVSSPDGEQVQKIEEQSFIESVFPVYVYKNSFGSSGRSGKVNLLCADDMTNYGISLFTEGTLVSGEFDEDGIMLDYLASQALGVGVGENLSFNLPGEVITKTVAAVYMTSTYGANVNGVALCKMPEGVAKPTTYGMAFVKASEPTVAETYLKTVFTAKTQVSVKSEAYEMESGRINKNQSNIDLMNILVTVSSVVMFLIAGTVFTVTNKKNDRINCDGGKSFLSMFGGYALSTLICAAAIAAVSALILFIVASQTFFLAECALTALLFSLSALMASPLVIAAAFVYVKIIYSNSAKI